MKKIESILNGCTGRRPIFSVISALDSRFPHDLESIFNGAVGVSGSRISEHLVGPSHVRHACYEAELACTRALTDMTNSKQVLVDDQGRRMVSTCVEQTRPARMVSNAWDKVYVDYWALDGLRDVIMKKVDTPEKI